MRLLLLPQQAFAHSFQFTFNYEKSTRWQQTWIRAKVIKYWASLGEYEENELPAVRRKHSFLPIYELLLSTAGILFLFVLQLEIDKKSNCVSYIHWVAQLAPTFCTFQRMPSQSGMSTKSLYPGEENVFTIIVIHNYLRNTKRESNVEGSLSFRIPCHKVRSINASQ